MADTNWNPGVCNEQSGFLFNHDCGDVATHKCDKCGKPICMSHTHQTEQGTKCTTCAKTEMQAPPGAPPPAGAKPPIAGQVPMGMQRPVMGYGPPAGAAHYYYSPYFYGSYYYPGYGYYGPGYWGNTIYVDYSDRYHHHPHNFTSGDADALGREGDGDFERDFHDS